MLLDFKIKIILERQVCYAAVGVLTGSSRWSVWRYFRCPWMVPTELCHLLIYCHEVPFLSFMSVLAADRVQQKVITGSSALAFVSRSWVIPEVTPACQQERRLSGVWASPHFLLSTAAPRQDRLLPDILLLCRIAALTKYWYILLQAVGRLWITSGMLRTELYWHSVETVGKAN